MKKLIVLAMLVVLSVYLIAAGGNTTSTDKSSSPVDKEQQLTDKATVQESPQAADQNAEATKEEDAKNSPTLLDFLQQQVSPPETPAVTQAPYKEEPKWEPQYGPKGELLNPQPMIYLTDQPGTEQPVTQGVIASNLLFQNFHQPNPWLLGTPPAGWTVLDSGSEGTQYWTWDKWHKFYYNAAGWYDTVAADNFAAGGQVPDSVIDNRMITPAFDLTGSTTCSLWFKQYYLPNTGTGALNDTTRVFVSTDNGATWIWASPILTQTTATSNPTRTQINLATYGSYTQVKLMFRHYIKFVGTSPTSTNGWIIDSVTVRKNNSSLWVQDFSNVMSGWYGDTPPSGPGGAWQILNNCVAPVKFNSTGGGNDWSRRAGNLCNDTVAANTRNGGCHAEWENDWLISPSFTIGSGVACTLSFAENWAIDNIGNYFPPAVSGFIPEHGYVKIAETTDGGGSWQPWQIVFDNNNVAVGTSNTCPPAVVKYDLNAWRNKTVRLAFQKVAPPECNFGTWYIKDVSVDDYTPLTDNVGTMQIVQPLIGIQGRNNPVKSKIFNNGSNAETFDDSTYISPLTGSTVFFIEEFSNPSKWIRANPPLNNGLGTYWAIGDSGAGAPKNDSTVWHAYYHSGWTPVDTVARVNYGSPTRWQNEWLISPSINCGTASEVHLTFNTYYYDAGVTSTDTAWIYGTTDDWATRRLIAMWNETHGTSSAPQAPDFWLPWANGQSNVKIAFVYHGNNNWCWYVDKVKVYEPTYGAVAYVSGETVTGMPALSTQVVNYATQWNNPTPGNYGVKSFTALVGDLNAADNEWRQNVTAYAHTGSGGPDGGGYTFKDDITGGGGGYNWLDISSFGQPILFAFGGTHQRWTSRLPLGFNFFYYGQLKNRIFVDENGYITFDSLTTYYSTNSSIPSSSLPNNVVGLFWDDLMQGLPGRAYYYTNNTDSAIVSFTDWGIYASPDTGLRFDAQAIFSKNDGKIKFQYRKFEPGMTISHTIGIENSGGTAGLQYEYNGVPMGNLPIPPLAITFTPPMDEIVASAISKPIQAWLVPGATYSVQGKFKNGGAVAQTFDVAMVINDGVSNVYYDSVFSISLNPADSILVDFDNLIPATTGTFTFTLTADNPGDEAPANNTLTRVMVSYPHDGTGGPDYGYYTWKDNTVIGGPTFGWVDTTGCTIPTLSSLDDGYSGAIALPSPFYFYGSNKSNIYISSNGFISFDALTSSYFSNATIPTSGLPNNILAVMWDDLVIPAANKVHYKNDTGNNRFVVMCDSARFLGGTTAAFISFQVILNYADSSIVYQYQNIGSGAQTDITIGIENGDGTVGLQYMYNATTLGGLGNYPTEQTVVKFKPTVPQDDILATGVTKPTGDMITGLTYPVEGSFKNGGTLDQTFDAYMTVKNGASVVYGDTVLSISLTAGLSTTVPFDSIVPAAAGVDTFILSLYNPGDEYAFDDMFKATRNVAQHYTEGGPDSSKYKWIDNWVPPTLLSVPPPVYNWVDTTGFTPISWSGSGDDSYSRLVMSAPFYFYGRDFTRIWAVTNGLLTFDSISTYPTYNQAIPSTVAPYNLIDFFRRDMYVGVAKYKDDIANNRFVFSFDSIWVYNTNAYYTPAQIILNRADSTVVVQYRDIGPTYTGTDFCVGVENGSGTTGLSYFYNNVPPANRPRAHLAIKYYQWQPDVDAVLVSHQKPAAAVLSSPVYPAVTVKNNGTSGMTFDVKEVIVGPAPGTGVAFDQTETTPSVDAGATLPFVFTTYSWNPSSLGSYTVYDSVFAVGEQWPADNAKTSYCAVINTMPLPCTSTFETDNGQFVGLGDWEWGAPTYVPGPPPDSIPSPTHLWGTKLAGPYTNGQLNSLYFPEVLLTGSTNFKVTFWMWHYLETYLNDGANLKISTNGGVTWTVLNTPVAYNGVVTATTNPMVGQPVWGGYRNWTQVVVDLTPYAYQTIDLRFDQASNSSTNYAGFYIDNVDLVLVPLDVGVVSIDVPPASQMLAAGTYDFKVTTQSFTMNPSTFDLFFYVDGAPYDSIMSISPPDMTPQQFTCPQQWVATAGSHTLMAKTVMAGDANSGNDSKSRTFTVMDKIVVPYGQNFDGTVTVVPPSGWTVLNNAGTGTWANATTKFRSSPNSAFMDDFSGTQDDWLLMPPIDLSTVAGAKLRFYEDQSYWLSYGEHHQIMVVVGNDFNVGSAVQVVDWTPLNHSIAGFAGAPVDLGLTAYNGQTIWLAFRYQGTFADEWYLDDVSLVELPAHDVAVTTLLAPTWSMVDAGGTYDIIAKFTNLGANSETFNATAFDNHGFTDLQTITDLAPFATVLDTFPGWNFALQCSTYVLTVATGLGTDTTFSNDSLTTSYVGNVPGNTAVQYDATLPSNGYYFYSHRDIIANRFEMDASTSTLSSIAFHFSNKDPYAYNSFPNGAQDSVIGYIFIDADNNGSPDAAPIYQDTLVTATYGWTIWPIVCDSLVSIKCQSFWAGYSHNDSLKPEAILVDTTTNYLAQKWIRSGGAWLMWNGITGDQMIRAYFNSDTPTPPVATFGTDPVTGEAIRPLADTVANTLDNTGLGCDLRYSVEVIQEIAAVAENASMTPVNMPLPGMVAIRTDKDRKPIEERTFTSPKGTYTEPVYPPMLLGSGGPDSYGYRWKDSDAPGGPTYSWVDISLIGTQVIFTSGQDYGYTSLFSIAPFSFNFYGLNYTSLMVSANAFVSFQSQTSGYDSNSPIPSSSAPNALLAVEWDDLYGRNANSKCYKYYDAAGNRFIISWLNWDYYSSPYNTHDLQVILDGNDNSIIYQYGPGTYRTYSTVGIENESGLIGLPIAYNQSYLHGSMAIKIWKPAVWLSTNLTGGVLGLDDPPRPFDIFMSAAQLPVGTYYGGIKISTNDTNKPVDTLLVTFTVNSVVVGETPAAIAHSQKYGTIANYPADFSISNSGTVTLNYTTSNKFAWITLSPASGSVGPSGSVPIDVQVNAPSLPGVYVDTVAISSNDPYTPTLRKPIITITVTAPVAGTSPDSVYRALQADTVITYSSAFAVSNTGQDSLYYTASNTKPWIALLPLSDSIPSGGNIPTDITVNTAGLAPGSVHVDSVTVTSNDPVRPTIKRPKVVIQVTAPIIGITPPTIAHVQESDIIRTYASDFTISNTGPAPLYYNVITSLPWVTPLTTSGRINSGGSTAIDVRVNSNGITTGIYHGQITVSSNDPVNSIRTVPVTITVSQIVPSIGQVIRELQQGQHDIVPFVVRNTSSTGVIVDFAAVELPLGSNADVPDKPSTLLNTWLFVEPAVDTIPAHDSASAIVILNAITLAPAVYDGVITVTSTNVTTSVVDIPVNLTVVPSRCVYIVGDFNGTGGFTGIDVTALLNYLRGWPVPDLTVRCPLCAPLGIGMMYPAGTVNGDCAVNGMDITYMVNYFRGGPNPVPCPQCLPPGPPPTMGTSSTTMESSE